MIEWQNLQANYLIYNYFDGADYDLHVVVSMVRSLVWQVYSHLHNLCSVPFWVIQRRHSTYICEYSRFACFITGMLLNAKLIHGKWNFGLLLKLIFFENYVFKNSVHWKLRKKCNNAFMILTVYLAKIVLSKKKGSCTFVSRYFIVINFELILHQKLY